MADHKFSITARAPGKLFFLGEYAVLFGGPAVVMAVDRYVNVTITAKRSGVTVRSQGAPLRILHATWQHDELCFDEPEIGHRLVITLLNALVANGFFHARSPGMDINIDSRELFNGEQKLGLGSSAAVAQALTLGVTEFAKNYGIHHEVDEGFEFNVHREFQGGQGSGADVAAGFSGGHFVYQRCGGNVLPLTTPVEFPSKLHCRYLWVGRPASTQSALQTMYDYQEQAPQEFTEALSPLLDLAQQGASALADGNSDAFLVACKSYCHNLSEFGRRIGVDIVSAPHAALLEEAQKLNLAYKPSGAGNGDFGIVFSKKINDLKKFERQVKKHNAVAMMLKPAQARHLA